MTEKGGLNALSVPLDILIIDDEDNHKRVQNAGDIFVVTKAPSHQISPHVVETPKQSLRSILDIGVTNWSPECDLSDLIFKKWYREKIFVSGLFRSWVLSHSAGH